MTNRVQTLSFLQTGQRPAAGDEDNGTLFVNIPDKQVGVVDQAGLVQ